VCHREGPAAIIEIPTTALAAHKAHGDYVTTLSVDPLNTVGDSIHFRRVTDAVDAVKAVRLSRGELTTAACRITIDVAKGTYKGSWSASTDPTFERFPLVIDVPNVTLHGAMQMLLDANGRARPLASGADASTFTPIPALIIEGGSSSQQGYSQEIIIVNAHPQGSSGEGAVIEGFVFQSGRAASDTTIGGQGVLTMRIKNAITRGNQFENGFTESIDYRASGGTIEKNYLIGRGNACDICIAGPGDFIVKDNRLDGPGGTPGILSTPVTILPVPPMVEQQVLPAFSLITSLITNNEVRNHQSVPAGVGIRIGAMGIGGPINGMSKATVTKNNLVRNRWGLFVEAAFPAGTLKGDVELTTSGNTFSLSCQNDFYVAFTRHVVGLGIQNNQPYLRNTTYDLTLDSDITWDNVWYANPEGFGNILTVNGATIPNGFRRAYDATKVCP
jgi:hypothetical protein